MFQKGSFGDLSFPYRRGFKNSFLSHQMFCEHYIVIILEYNIFCFSYRYVRAYVGCVVGALKGCDILYQNWVALISRYSSVPYAVKICGVRVSLRTGEVDVRPDGNDVAFNVENGRS